MTFPYPSAAAMLVLSLSAVSHPVARAEAVGPLLVRDAWIRATPNAAPTAAAYLTVTNRGNAPDRLLGGSTSVAASIEPHTMSMAGGVMRMRLAPSGFEIPPGGALTLAPGGDHLMLIAPRRVLIAGAHVPALLRFARAGAVKVEFTVRGRTP